MARPGNSDGWPDGLPDLPPDWGPIVIPDDPAELAAEARLVRRELRQQALRGKRAGIKGQPASQPPEAAQPPSLRLPLIIMALAVLTTLTSLFAVGWSGPQRQLTDQPAPTDGAPPGQPLPALDVVDASGATVPLRGLVPTVIMLPERCACTEQIAATAAAAPAGVTVVTLTSAATQPSPTRTPLTGAPVRALADPAGELRSFLKFPPTPGAATVLLVGAAGEIVRVLPASTSVEDYRVDLALLASRQAPLRDQPAAVRSSSAA